MTSIFEARRLRLAPFRSQSIFGEFLHFIRRKSNRLAFVIPDAVYHLRVHSPVCGVVGVDEFMG
jgi:hypothetical protein